MGFITRENPVSEASDRIYMILLVIALIAGFSFSLGSVGYLLGFNATTLVLIAMSFTVMSGNYWYRGTQIQPVNMQLQATSLAIIPIALRWALQMPFFNELIASTSDVSAVQQLGYMAQVLGLWILVAVSEEAFRAAMLNAADLFLQFTNRELTDRWKILFANSVWIGFHFLQRPLDLTIYGPYIVWLFVSGLVMTWALMKVGLGSATLIHLIINLTA
jgi:hypothetical protein